MKTELSIEEIFEYLPHRYPFLLVDKVMDFVPEKSLRAIKNVTINENFFNGHFPGKPVMPGVLMIEALAQACVVFGFLSANQKASDSKSQFLLAGVDNARFKRVVSPGDQLVLDVELIRARGDLWKMRGEANVDGELACSVEITSMKSEINRD